MYSERSNMLADVLHKASRRFRNLRGRAWRTAAAASGVSAPPIIILGKEKSGTTAIAALLAERTGSSITLDMPSLWGTTVVNLYTGKRTFHEYVRRNRPYFSRDIIKEPELTFIYPSVKARFPRARFVMIVRDPRDNIRSVLNRVQIEGSRERLDAGTLAGITEEWRIVLDGGWLGLRGETYIEMAAARWNRAADVYLHHADDMVLVRYEDFMDEKAGTIDRLAERLELPLTNDIRGKLDVQYQPRGNRDVPWEQFFGDRNLRRIERTCMKRMKKLGYFPYDEGGE